MKVCLSLSLCAHTLEAHGWNRRDEPRVSVDFPRVRLTSQATTFRPYRSSQTPWNRPFPLWRTDPTQQNTRKRERDRQKRLHRPPSGILTFSAFFLQSNQIVKNQVDIISLHVLKVYIRKQVDPPTTTTKGKQQKTWHNGPRVIW